MATITIQIGETGNVPIPEHNAQLKSLLKSFSEKEVDITIKESTDFSSALSESVRLQNKFTESVNEIEKTWTDADFALLRGKMSAVSMSLYDFLAIAQSDKKTTEALCQRVYFERKEFFFENEKCNITTASLKAKTSKEYTYAEDKYLQSYKYAEILEMHTKALNAAMNAIAGIQKSGISYLKF